jgi:hypothetical protein
MCILAGLKDEQTLIAAQVAKAKNALVNDFRALEGGTCVATRKAADCFASVKLLCSSSLTFKVLLLGCASTRATFTQAQFWWALATSWPQSRAAFT